MTLHRYFTHYTGNKWIDFSSQLFNLQLGHQHPKVSKAIHQQLIFLFRW
jgi:taurine--2-oxoglutarate transaminase